jgi:endonuclease/exonuclease/phosphatase family metal-dependent hydrolase
VENLLRPGGEFAPEDQADYAEKLAALAEVINTVAPDVMGLQEVGSHDALTDLVALLEGDWRCALSTLFEPHRQIRVAVIARHPVEVVAEVIDFPPELAPLQAYDDPAKRTTRMGRGALAARVDLAGQDPITGVSCHLKSKLLSFPPTSSGRTRFHPHDKG